MQIDIYLKFIGNFQVPQDEPTAEEMAEEEKQKQRRAKNREKVARCMRSTKTETASAHRTEAGSVSRSIPSIGTSASTAKSGGRIGRLHKTRRSKQRDGWSALICILLSGRALKIACRKSISARQLLRWNARAFPANAATKTERSSA